MMRVLMTGGTGFLGTALRARLEQDGHTITCLSRFKTGSSGNTTFLSDEALAGLGPHDVILNLAGASVVGLWTKRKRSAIYESRIQTTRNIADWIEKSSEKPAVFR